MFRFGTCWDRPGSILSLGMNVLTPNSERAKDLLKCATACKSERSAAKPVDNPAGIVLGLFCFETAAGCRQGLARPKGTVWNDFVAF